MDPNDNNASAIRGEVLRNQLDAGQFVRKALHYSSVNSTNVLAKQMALLGEPGGLLLLTDEQTAGKGRMGRSFISPNDGGLWFTLLLRPQNGASVSSVSTLIAGTAVCQALQACGITEATIKWPNDILIGDCKTAGILAESGFDQDQQPYLVLGIGINLTIKAFPTELTGIATSVQMATGRTIDRIDLLGKILQRYSVLSEQLAIESFGAIRPQYLACSSTIGRDILLLDQTQKAEQTEKAISTEDRRKSYRCIDIADDGSLVLIDENGCVLTQNSGEISLRYPADIKGKKP
jgi:BirA family biotin operon repressor/biotin-[acetyl-CoA-carboxylase] ligase